MVEETKQPVQQETQPAGASQAPQTGQPVQPQVQPAQTAAQPQPIKKKSKWWIWLIVELWFWELPLDCISLFFN